MFVEWTEQGLECVKWTELGFACFRRTELGLEYKVRACGKRGFNCIGLHERTKLGSGSVEWTELGLEYVEQTELASSASSRFKRLFECVV